MEVTKEFMPLMAQIKALVKNGWASKQYEKALELMEEKGPQLRKVKPLKSDLDHLGECFAEELGTGQKEVVSSVTKDSPQEITMEVALTTHHLAGACHKVTRKTAETLISGPGEAKAKAIGESLEVYVRKSGNRVKFRPFPFVGYRAKFLKPLTMLFIAKKTLKSCYC